jgi:hypothetical protein
MNAQTHDAYLARAELAELRARELNARVKRLESQAQDAVHVHVSTEQRIAALEAAARAVTARGGHADGCLIRDYGGCTCGWEQALADLAALLEEGA